MQTIPWVTLADLAHTGAGIGANNSPLAIGYVGAFLKARYGETVDVQLFKYPERFASALEHKTPVIAAFSNYMWNERLAQTFARAIKAHHPEVITVFGGPNYPIDPREQQRYLEHHPEIDFYIDGEGELAFAELYEQLRVLDFDLARFKMLRPAVPNLHYFAQGEFVRNALATRTLTLDETYPSPYLMGMMDEFFDTSLNPLIQTSRGCPYSCTFCHDGLSYMNKTRRFSQARVAGELEYAAERARVPALTLADLNWGMFPEDIETAHVLAGLREKLDWPRFVASATAKNQKDRVVEMARILGDAMQLGASVQSTDTEVLKNIKRSNIGIDAIVTMAKRSASTDTVTFTEIILCLPGDTKEKHFKSVFDMMDAGIQEVRTYQLILLPGTETSTPLSRETYQYKTLFRILPRSFGKYTLYGQCYPVAEMHEVCVGNNTMPYEDYLECRRFNLTLAIFNNGNIFDEIILPAELLGAKRSLILARIHEMLANMSGPLLEIYQAYAADERKNFWSDPDALQTFVTQELGIDRYLKGEFGTNQIFIFRTRALLECFPILVSYALAATREVLESLGVWEPLLEQFFAELKAVLCARKEALGDLSRDHVMEVSFDFVAMQKQGYRVLPHQFMLESPLPIHVRYDASQKKMLRDYLTQYGAGATGIAHFMHRNSARELYRRCDYVQVPQAAQEQALAVL